MNNNNLIVTRHAGLVAWLNERGITGDVVAHATPETVEGRHVFGVLPLNLAAHAASVTNVDMPRMSAEQRGKDLTPAEMDAAGASLSTYCVLDQVELLRVRQLVALARDLGETEASTPRQGDLLAETGWVLAHLPGRLGVIELTEEANGQ